MRTGSIISSLTPHGVSGLKLLDRNAQLHAEESHPTRGEWIEMLICVNNLTRFASSHPTRGEWIEME